MRSIVPEAARRAAASLEDSRPAAEVAAFVPDKSQLIVVKEAKGGTMTNEDSAFWETDAVTGVTCLSTGSWTALVARKSDGWHYLVHSGERAGGFIGASIQSQRGFQKRAEAQQAAEAVMVEQGALSAHAAAELIRQRLPRHRDKE
ncbi:hypothetical protein EI613_02775 [Azospirillum sp. 412522]|nr:hypothetical protein [Azospirillum sp. 412522]MBY6260847.1 hypothetical protein [Azospirillum sp. 412522]